VNSPQVTIVGDTMTINPSLDLTKLKNFSVRIDRGAVISVLQTLSVGNANKARAEPKTARGILQSSCIITKEA
jgi:hypothetical protein